MNMQEELEHQAFASHYAIQREMANQVIKESILPTSIQRIAGADVAYNDKEDNMIGALVVLDANTLEVIEKVTAQMPITFPYVPGLFSFREVPVLKKAFEQLKIKPDIIVCDGHGIAHPKGVGMASHLGIELDIPTIGCAKKRLIGQYDKEALGTPRGNQLDLSWQDQVIGKVLRTQDGIKPVFVSTGHKVALADAVKWVLKLCPKYRLPETTREADQLVNALLKGR